jgi:hypothetical protein
MQLYARLQDVEVSHSLNIADCFHDQKSAPEVDTQVYEVSAGQGRQPNAELAYHSAAQSGNFQEHAQLMAAVEAQLSLARAIEALRTARQSETSLKQQADLGARNAGAGGSEAADSPPSDSRLAVAQARRTESERQLRAAMKRCEALFGAQGESLEQLVSIGTPVLLMQKLKDKLGESVPAAQSTGEPAGSAGPELP